MPLLKNNVYALNRLTKHRLKNGQNLTSGQTSYRHIIATRIFRNFTSNEKSCTGLVFIVLIFLSVWPHKKITNFWESFISFCRSHRNCHAIQEVCYRSYLSELNTAIFLSDPSDNSWPICDFFSFFLSFRYYLIIRQYIYIYQCGNKY